MTRATLELDGVAHDVHVVRKADGSGWTVTVDGQDVEVRLQRNGHGLRLEAAGRTLQVELRPDGSASVDGRERKVRVAAISDLEDAATGGAGHGAKVRPPMNGKLERILVQPGQAVAKGDVLFVLEAMKMQNEVRSPVAGKVAAVHGKPGAVVEPSHVIVELGPA